MFRKFGLSVLVLFFIYSCNSDGSKEQGVDEKINGDIGQLDDENTETKYFSDTLVVRKGDLFEFELNSGSVNGFQWKLVKNLPEGVVAFKGKDYLNGGETTIGGGGGSEFWIFNASKKGKCTIRFSFGREWEDSAVEIRDYLIIVK